MYSGCVSTYVVGTYGRMAARAAVGEGGRASDMRRMQSWPCVGAVVVQRGALPEAAASGPFTTARRH